MSLSTAIYKVYLDNEFLVVEAVGNTSIWREKKGLVVIAPYPDPTMGGSMTTMADIRTDGGTNYANVAKNENFIDANGVAFSPTGSYSVLEAAILALINTPAMGAGLSTEAKQDVEIAELQAIKANQTNATQKTQITPLPLPVTLATANPIYTAAITYTIANTPTDFFGITGSATKKVKIRSIKIYAQESQILGGGNIRTMPVIKRSTANTGGATTAVVRVPLDSTTAAATAVVLAYTANPTTGTTVGSVGAHQLTHSLGTTISAQFGLELIKEPIILNSATEGVYLNGLGVTRPNNIYSITIIWEEY